MEITLHSHPGIQAQTQTVAGNQQKSSGIAPSRLPGLFTKRRACSMSLPTNPETTSASGSRNWTEGDGIVIVDHGSRRAQSNSMLHAFVDMYKQKTGRFIVEPAHMELANPTIEDAFGRCVDQGAKRVIVTPYFLFPGRHWEKDIPALTAEAAKAHPDTPYIVTAPIGLHELMVKVIEDRIDYCVSQVSGNVAECEMCAGTGRCKVMQAQTSSVLDASSHAV